MSDSDVKFSTGYWLIIKLIVNFSLLCDCYYFCVNIYIFIALPGNNIHYFQQCSYINFAVNDRFLWAKVGTQTFLSVANQKNLQYLSSFCNPESANFLGVWVPKSQIRIFYLSVNRKSANFSRKDSIEQRVWNSSFQKFNPFSTLSWQTHHKFGSRFLRPNFY